MDPVKNFAKVLVYQRSGWVGYNEQSTSIRLVSGHDNLLPDVTTEGPYNLVWWNITDYPDPADQNFAYVFGTDTECAEIVRCTAMPSTNTITITRAQEGTTATRHNKTGKTYAMAVCITKKIMDDLGIFTPSGTGSVARSFQSKLLEHVSVTDFGAVASGTTDNTVAFQKANDALIAATYGGIIFVPPGSWGLSTSTSLNLSPRVHLMGSGAFSTFLVSIGNNTMVQLTAAQTRTEISGICFRGSSTTGTIIDLNGASYPYIHNCYFENKTTAIDITTTGSYWGTIQDNVFSGFTNGILLSNGCNAHRILSNDFLGVMEMCIKMVNFTGDNIWIQNNTFGTTSTVSNIYAHTDDTGYAAPMTQIISNRFDGATTGAVVDLKRYVQADVKLNSFACASPNHIASNGTLVTIGENYHAASTGAAISLGADSAQNRVYKSKFGPDCASKYSNSGTYGNIFEMLEVGGLSSAISHGDVIPVSLYDEAGQVLVAEYAILSPKTEGKSNIRHSISGNNISVGFDGGGTAQFYWRAGAKP